MQRISNLLIVAEDVESRVTPGRGFVDGSKACLRYLWRYLWPYIRIISTRGRVSRPALIAILPEATFTLDDNAPTYYESVALVCQV